MDEQLEEINNLLRIYYGAEDLFEQTDLAIDIIQGHIGWLIQQAERVEELELDRNDWKDEAGKWCRRFHEVDEEHLETKEYLNLVIKQNQRYKQALEFYADEENYDRPYDNEDYFDYLPSEMDFDKGEKARQTLRGETE